MTQGPAVVVVAGGDPPPPRVVEALPSPIVVIAADSGLTHARHLRLAVDLLVGDLDSITAEETALHPGLRVEPHSPDKDKTDLELAIEKAMALEPPEVIVVGGAGGRLDHLLANAALIASPKFANTPIRWLAGGSETRVVRNSARFTGSPGDLVSLLAYGGAALGVTTSGLRWPLHQATLEPGSSWGVSNEMTRSAAEIELAGGVLLAIRTDPHPERS
ncbi:MAG TPA: thiamine diphosphokinase [Acidimicrobiia bacterium]|nr:thiamine diphosphokinase [Acidimicrobiia bacterium]